MAHADRPRAQLRAERRRLRAMAGDVDRGQRAAALQYRRAIGSVRCIPQLGDRPLAKRPSRGSGRGRLLLRRLAGGDCGVWHTGGHYQLATDPGGLSAARSAGIRADLQHGAGGIRGARRPGDGAGSGDWPAGGGAGFDDRAAVAGDRGDPAVLCDGALWRLAFRACALAGAAGRGRELCHYTVRVVQLHRLRAHRRAVLARFTDRYAAVRPVLAAGTGPRVQDRGHFAGGRAPGIGRACLAGLASLGDRIGNRDPVDLIQGGRDRAA